MRTALAMLLLVAACVRERQPPDVVVVPTWRDDVEPLVSDRCAGCHGGATPAGGYDLGTYLGALGGGSDDIANAIAGDPGSAMLAVIEAGGDHASFADALPVLRAWILDGRVGYFDSPIHPPGILDRTSSGFHGVDLEAGGWDFARCQRCHGEAFDGGPSGVTCKSCHQEGPTGCGTCHDASPTTGAHPAHLAADVACTECHRVPARWDAPGHIVTDGRVDPTPAEVQFGALAWRDLDPPRRTGPPRFDPIRETCANVFCHGGAFADGAARMPTPVWTTAGAQAPCGACHGLPPEDHAPVWTACATCHSRADGDHVDGVLQIGDGSGGCDACHGGATSSGAHRSHLEAPSGLRAPLACGDCHGVPAAVDSPGHLDSAPPAEVVLSSGSWDHSTATCAGSACHGAATPDWTRVGVGEAACGTCHGVPPAGHDPAIGVFDCVDCHPAFDEGKHMDGHVDL